MKYRLRGTAIPFITLILGLAIALIAGSAQALDPTRTIDQLIHTSWTMENGAPQDIAALAQTVDGYLWIGCSRGLYRFDGVTFEKISGFDALPARSDSVTGLLASRSGELWIGHSWGGLSVYRNGRLEDANPAPPQGGVRKIVQDARGGIWAVSTGAKRTGVRHFQDGHWDILEAGDWGLPNEYIKNMLADRDGSIWMTFRGSAVHLPAGSHNFEKVDAVIGNQASLAQAGDGRIWIVDTYGIRPLYSPPRKGEERRDDVPTSFIADRDGTLWAIGSTHGLIRIRNPDAVSQSREGDEPEEIEDTEKAHLFSNASGVIFEDREGNIWFSSTSGLDRLKTSNFVVQIPASAAPTMGENGALVASTEGDVYALSVDVGSQGVLRYHAGHIDTPHAIAADAVTICEARDGGIWIVSPKQISHYQNGQIIKTIAAPTDVFRPNYQNCSEDGSGRLWLAGVAHNPLRYDGRSWSQVDVAQEEGKKLWPGLQAVDRQGREMMYFGQRSLMRVDGDKIETIWDSKQISIRYINAIYVVGDDVYLGGEHGLAVLDSSTSKVKVLNSERFPFLTQITGITQTAAGDTWMLTSAGVIRVSSADLATAFDHPEADLPARIFDFYDGLRGQSVDGMANNAVAGSVDGRVWFNTSGGLIWIDPNHLYHNDLPPSVRIRGVNADGVALPPKERLRLPEGASSLRLDYTALSLTTPERVLFRYRLTGVDKDWVDAGTRRQAFYTNLAPGSYHFQVIASNNDGVWNTIGASADLEIPPTFLQSRWFLGLCVAAFVAVLWLLYHLRVRQLAARLRLKMTVRMEERERIARELHDTLLQSVQGLIFHIHEIVQLSSEPPVRMRIEHALDQADDLLAEGRQRVIDLRATEAGGDLGKALNASMARMLRGSDIEASLTTKGSIREVPAQLSEEMIRISDEFLLNTLRHAAAGKVDISINYGFRSLIVRFADDGQGIDPRILANGGREGHFGLRGMRERAEKIGGSFLLLSPANRGTELTITIPASAAYL